MLKLRGMTILLASASMAVPTGSASAQSTTENAMQVNSTDVAATNVATNDGFEAVPNNAEPVAVTDREDDDNDFPWGLLGLLGLAGLLGRKRRDDDIHVDARRDSRPS